MEEEEGEEDTEHEERESGGKNVNIKSSVVTCFCKSKIPPDQPGHITKNRQTYVDVSEFLTETDTGVFTTTANVQSGESKESDSGEDNEGGMSVEDLQRGFIEDVDSREEGEQELGQE